MRITAEDRRIAANIDFAKRTRGMSNAELAQALGRHGNPTSAMNWVQERVSGKRPLTVGQFKMFAEALGIPQRVLAGRQEHILRFLSEHPELVPDLVTRPSRWTDISAGHSLERALRSPVCGDSATRVFSLA